MPIFQDTAFANVDVAVAGSTTVLDEGMFADDGQGIFKQAIPSDRFADTVDGDRFHQSLIKSDLGQVEDRATFWDRVKNAGTSFTKGAIEGILVDLPIAADVMFQQAAHRGIETVAPLLHAVGKGELPKQMKEATDEFIMENFIQGSLQIKERIEEVFPGRPELQDDFVTSVLARGAGQLGTQVVAGMATGGLGLASLTAAQMSSQEYQQALEATGDEEKAFEAFLVNMPIGALDAIPVARWMRRFDKVTGGGVKQVLKKGFVGGAEEMTQEVVQQALSNVAAGQIYDESRRVLDGVAEGGAAGAILGFVANAVGVSVRQRFPKAKTRADAAEAFEAVSEADARAKRIEEEATILSEDVFIDEPVEVGGVPATEAQGPRAFPQDFAGRPELPPPHLGATAVKDVSPTQPALDLNIDEGFDTWWSKFKAWTLSGAPSKFGGRKELFLPKSIRRLQLESEAKIERELAEVRINDNKLVNQLRKEYLGKTDIKRAERFFTSDEASQIPDQVWQDIDDVLRGKYDRTALVRLGQQGASVPGMKGPGFSTQLGRVGEQPGVPLGHEVLQEQPTGPVFMSTELFTIVRQMRLHVDRLSRQAMKSKIISDPLRMAIRNGIGSYLFRSYRVHDLPAWSKNVPEDVLLDAFTFVKQAYKAQGKDLNETQINNVLQAVLVKQAGDDWSTWETGKLGSIDVSPFIRRKDIAPEIRALLGEYTNPVANYVRTVSKLANVVNNEALLERTYTAGRGTYFFDSVLDAPFGYVHEIAPEGDRAMGALAGKVTHPDIADAFRRAFKESPFHASGVIQWAIAANATAKYSKTVLNQVTHVRNVLGGAYFMAGQGHAPSAAHFKEAQKVWKAIVLSDVKGTFEEKFLHYAELGLTGAGARAGEMKQVIESAQDADDAYFLRNFNHLTAGLSDKGIIRRFQKGKASVYGNVRLGADMMSELYQSEDVAMRILMFESEHARLKEAYKGDPNAPAPHEIEREAAWITRNTYQDWAQVPSHVRALSQLPLIGSFVGFQSEVIRTVANTFDIVKHELAHDNPKRRKIAYRRIAGMTTMLGLDGAMQVTGAGALGLLGSAVLAIGSEEDEDIKRFVPEWDKDSALIHLSKGGTTRWYVNPSYYNPYGLITEPILALFFGQEDQFLSRLGDAFMVGLKPFFREEIMAQKMQEFIANKKRNGSRIVNPEESLANKATTVLAHFWDGIEPGAVTSVERTVRSVTDEPKDLGRNLEPAAEVIAMFGFRGSQVDIPTSLFFRGKDFSRRRSNASAVYNDVVRDPASTDVEIEQAYQALSDTYYDAFFEMLEITEGGFRLGMEWKEIEAVLERAGVGIARTAELKRGFPSPPERKDIADLQ